MNKQYFLDKLIRDRPSVFENYNYDFLPPEFKAHDKIAIDCYKHGVFYQKACSHLFSAGCPECSKERVAQSQTLTTEDFIYKSKSKFGEKFGYEKTRYIKQGHDLTITCPHHGDIVLKPEKHFWTKYGCHKCDFEIPRAERRNKAIKEAERVHKGKFDYSKVIYVNSVRPVEIVCPIHGSFWQSMSTHIVCPIACPKCSREADRGTSADFVTKAKEIHGEHYDYGKVEYKTAVSMVTITCKKHGDFNQRANSHLSGNGCKKCFLERNRGNTELFIKQAKQIHGDKYDYSRVKYTESKTPVEIICRDHGPFWQTPNSHVSSSSGCRFCLDSKGEREVESVLKKYGISHIREYRIKPYLYRFDFYLPGLEIYIEFNGIQHYLPVECFGGKRAFLKVQENDRIKKGIVRNKNAFLAVVTYRSLTNGSVEKDLIREFKVFYRYWFLINGELRVFRKASDLRKAFKIPLSVRNENLIFEIQKLVPDFKELF